MKPATACVRYGIKCIVPSCDNKMSTNRSVSYFSFPKDTIRCKKWIENSKIGIDIELIHKKQYKICGEHFEEKMFLNDLKNRLQPHAIPSLFATDLTKAKTAIMPEQTAAECKKRWKNIRAVFVRNMKPAPSGAGAKTKRTYYLMESMQFTVPYIKALGAPSGNLPNPPEQKEDKESEKNDSTAHEENVLEPQCSFQQPPTPSLPYPSSPLPSPTPLHTTEMSQSKKNTTHSQPEPFPSNLPNRKRGFKNPVDKAFLEYFETKRARALNSSDHMKQDPKTEGLKMFLLSMLPDLLKMSDEGVRLFKRRALQSVDDILSHSLEYTTSNTFSASSTPSTHSEIMYIPQDANVNNTSQFNRLGTSSSQSTAQFYNAVNEGNFLPEKKQYTMIVVQTPTGTRAPM